MKILLLLLALVFPVASVADHQALITWIRIQPDHAFGSADLITSMDGCVIRVPAPKGENDRRALYVLGHEVVHCFDGQYHQSNQVPPTRTSNWGDWDLALER